MTSLMRPLGQCCSNFMWRLLWAGEWKIAKMVVVHWPRWLPCPYMVNTFKNLLQNRECHDWIFAQIIGDGRSIKSAKMMVIHWRLTFYGKVKFTSVCICMGPIHLYRKIIDNFKWPPLKPLGQCCSNFMWSLPGAGERKIAKMVMVHWLRWLPCPYMIKPSVGNGRFKSQSIIGKVKPIDYRLYNRISHNWHQIINH